MDPRVVCLLLVPLVVGHIIDPGLPDHLHSVVSSDDIDGYSLGTVQESEGTSSQDTGQTPSSEKQFSLILNSGERISMLLTKYSVDTSGGTVTEITEDGRREVTKLQAQDCFFSGRLEGVEGYANLATCDGELMGSVTTDDLLYEVHSLPAARPINKRSTDDVARVLVTWKNESLTFGEEGNDQRILDQMATFEEDGLEIPEEDAEDETTNEKNGKPPIRTKRNIRKKRVTIEFADYLDSHFLADVKRRIGVSTTRQLTNLILSKWSAVAKMLGKKRQVGWGITLKLVNLEIWRSNPRWYRTSRYDSFGDRLNEICQGTRDMDYDHVTLHTGGFESGRVGLSWIGGMCWPRYKCVAVRSAKTNFHTELHEFGHSMGLKHDGKMDGCKRDSDSKGFMGGVRDHFRKCYREVLDNFFRNPKKDCLHTQEFGKGVKTF